MFYSGCTSTNTNKLSGGCSVAVSEIGYQKRAAIDTSEDFWEADGIRLEIIKNWSQVEEP